jgi:hypothetical protein
MAGPQLPHGLLLGGHLIGVGHMLEGASPAKILWWGMWAVRGDGGHGAGKVNDLAPE